MQWLNSLFSLAELPPFALEKFASHRLLRHELAKLDGRKGAVRFARDHKDVIVGITVIVDPDQSRPEREVTLVHEHFHLVLGATHPEGDMMMQTLSQRAYDFVEERIDAAAYEFQRLHPRFVADFYDRLLGRSERTQT